MSVGSIANEGFDAPPTGAGMDHARARRIRRFHQVSRVTGAAVMVLGVTVLVGWALDVELFVSLYSSLASMKANTALLFVLLGCALLLQQKGRAHEPAPARAFGSPHRGARSDRV